MNELTNTTNNLSLETNHEELRDRFEAVRIVSLLVLAFAVPAIIVIVVFGLITRERLFLELGTIGALLASVHLFFYYLSRPSVPRTLNRANLLSRLIPAALLIFIIAIQTLFGSGGSLSALYLGIPIAASILGVSILEVVLGAILSAISLTVLYVTQKIFVLYKVRIDHSSYPIADLIIWLIIVTIIVSSIIIFIGRINKAANKSHEQADLLRNLLKTLDNTTRFGSTLSNELSGVTTELNVISREHESTTQEQVAAVTQVTVSLEELNETANQIAIASQATTQAVSDAVNVATQVKEASELAQTTTSQGTEAIEQTVISIDRARNRIELLGQRLLNLTEHTRRVSTIIDIMDEIADETHLLALNASIEAAGGSNQYQGVETSLGTNNRGERFGIIAQEVKNLSERSRESTEEVRQTIKEMQGAVAAAVLIAEEGKKDTSAALARSQIAGMVIDVLNEVVRDTAERAKQILSAVEAVNDRSDEITVASGQQRSANGQIVETMRNVALVARESVEAVATLSMTVSHVNNRVAELNSLLDQSNQSLQATAV